MLLKTDIVEACIKNNRKAQKQLFDQNKDAMFTIAYRILGNHEDAADALQEGFINVFLSLKTFKGNSTIGAWIKTIIIRTSIKQLRKQMQFDTLEDNLYAEESFYFDDGLTGETLENAILSLDSGYRTVFLLVEVEGYKHKEVAEMLNISEGTSRSQLYKAKRALQKKLKQYE